MKFLMLIAGLLTVMAVAAKGGQPKPPPDVIIYVEDGGRVPGPVVYGAIGTVDRMFERIGIRLEWRGGEVTDGGEPDASRVIQIRFTEILPGDQPGALASALPFARKLAPIHISYDRIEERTFGVRDLQEPLLAHVLAHEIGHLLMRTNAHARTGVMKAYWDAQDYYAMKRKPLEFTVPHTDLIRAGVSRKDGTKSPR